MMTIESLTSLTATGSLGHPPTATVLAAVALPFVGAGLVPIVYRLLGERIAYYCASVAFGSFVLVGSLYGTEGTVSVPWIPSLGVSFAFTVDGLALLVGFLASGIGVLVLTYSRGYMHGEEGLLRYYTTMLVFLGAMLGVVFAADLIALFVFWELTSVSSFLLVGQHRHANTSLYAARKAMVVTVAGGLFMLVGFLLLVAVTPVALGSRTFSLAAMLTEPEAIRQALVNRGFLLPVLGLIGIGAAAKSAQVPFHFWLPDAMEAPTPVSAFLHSATMVKAGVYLVGRFRPLLLTEEWTLLFATLGLVTMTLTAMLAVAATDIKELLAYSTASHLGLIVAAFGFGSVLGGQAGVFHILNHALFKAALFLVAGIVAHQTGTRVISELGGLWRELPITAAVTVIAGLGMAGIPPFNGFYSKELFFELTVEAARHTGQFGILIPLIAVFGSIFTVLYSLRFITLFFGSKPPAIGAVARPSQSMIIPVVLLGGLTLLVSIAPSVAIEGIVDRAFGSTVVNPAGHHVHAGIPTDLSAALAMSTTTIGLGIVGYRRYPTYPRTHDWVHRLLAFPLPWPDTMYDASLVSLADEGRRLVDWTHNGRLRTYAGWVLAGMTAIVAGAHVATAPPLPTFELITLSPTTVIVLGVTALAAAAVARAPSHIAGVLILSILGLMLAIFYVVANAPDLALTQLVVETLVLVIFLLVLDRLPAFYGEAAPSRVARDTMLSVGVGMTVMITVLLSTARRAPDPIFHFFVSQAPDPTGGGGHNVVNVILVDFRALDTLGEISVIGIAAVSVVTLIAMRDRGELQ